MTVRFTCLSSNLKAAKLLAIISIIGRIVLGIPLIYFVKFADHKNNFNGDPYFVFCGVIFALHFVWDFVLLVGAIKENKWILVAWIVISTSGIISVLLILILSIKFSIGYIDVLIDIAWRSWVSLVVYGAIRDIDESAYQHKHYNTV